mmetsp:Transcript_41242/g.81335  ORF Transcript_41242/g.81335 Transcript_41242/m.81335 type:complete len:713 (-) Transcript_41242:141-2279(-)
MRVRSHFRPCLFLFFVFRFQLGECRQRVDSRRTSAFLSPPHVRTSKRMSATTAVDQETAKTEVGGKWSSSAFLDAVSLATRIQQESISGTFQAKLRKAVDVCRNTLRVYRPGCVYCSFNGGKDAVVVLHLLRAALGSLRDPEVERLLSRGEGPDSIPSSLLPLKPKLVFFHNGPEEFEEIEQFVKDTKDQFDLELKLWDGGYVEGLRHIVGETPSALAFILGTRDGDPNSANQGTFEPSSDWMPPFMRVNPILEWTYGDVWTFIRSYDLPYCDLYDKGYTSVGKKSSTLPNPALLRINSGSADQLSYLPAYCLNQTDWGKERAGRDGASANRRPLSLQSMQDGEDEKEQSVGLSPYLPQQSPSPPGDSGQGQGKTAAQAFAFASTNANAEKGVSINVPSPAESPKRDFSAVSSITPLRHSSAASSALSGPPDESGVNRRLLKAKTAGLVVIGDEILKGLTADLNGPLAVRKLRAVGVKMQRICVVGDEEQAITDEVRRQLNKYDVVITSGGVGATHDDVTIRAVASALGEELQPNAQMLSRIAEAFKLNETAITPAHRKMAMLPPSTTLRDVIDTSGKKSPWPVLQIDRVFVLPGVPKFFAAKMDVICGSWLGKPRPKATRKVTVALQEEKLVSLLNEIVSRFPSVSFGSYPIFREEKSRPRTVIILETEQAAIALLRDALQELLERLPEQCVVSVEESDSLETAAALSDRV